MLYELYDFRLGYSVNCVWYLGYHLKQKMYFFFFVYAQNWCINIFSETKFTSVNFC